MTAVSVRQCEHLRTGETRTYVEIGVKRWCLDCVALRFVEWGRPQNLYHIWAQVTEAREQKLRR